MYGLPLPIGGRGNGAATQGKTTAQKDLLLRLEDAKAVRKWQSWSDYGRKVAAALLGCHMDGNDVYILSKIFGYAHILEANSCGDVPLPASKDLPTARAAAAIADVLTADESHDSDEEDVAANYDGSDAESIASNESSDSDSDDAPLIPSPSMNRMALGEQALSRTVYELEESASKFGDLAKFLKNHEESLSDGDLHDRLLRACGPAAALVAEVWAGVKEGGSKNELGTSFLLAMDEYAADAITLSGIRRRAFHSHPSQFPKHHPPRLPAATEARLLYVRERGEGRISRDCPDVTEARALRHPAHNLARVAKRKMADEAI
ncbi:hypothetical protein C8J57DRAFT_1515717 [Mycena rebaudengoi]|nr:hypothetical protein C8J57DRAFT_1515717 [Mycena rebaudengoi]